MFAIEADPLFAPTGFREWSIAVPFPGNEKDCFMVGERFTSPFAQLFLSFAFAYPDQGEIVESAATVPIKFVLSWVPFGGIVCAREVLHATDAGEVDIATYGSVGYWGVVKGSLGFLRHSNAVPRVMSQIQHKCRIMGRGSD